MTRWPLWVTLLPLVAGVLVWYWVWDGYRDAFVAQVQAVLPGATVSGGGFPYRLEAGIAPVSVRREGAALKAEVSAAELRINRVPWQKDREVLEFKGVEARIALSPLAGMHARVEAAEAVSSLRRADDRVARLSIVWAKPTLHLGFLPGALTAEKFEAHVRETPSPDSAGPRTGTPSSPRLPTQAQMVLTGEGVRWSGGDPLALRMEMEFTAAQPLGSYAAWAVDGTAEMETLTLTDATGRVALIKATLVPDGAGRLRIAGTLETVCPATLRALARGEAPPVEQRARRPITMAFSGMVPGGIQLPPADPTKPPPPVRGQEPPCPAFIGAMAARG